MDLGLENKKVLITGGSRGIGKAIAENFLSEKSKVLIVSRGSKELFKAERELKNKYGENEVYAEAHDCSDQEELEILKEKVLKIWGELDVLIANVGDGKSMNDPIPDDFQWEKTWKTNFGASLYSSRIFLPLIRQNKGSILFISSIAAKEAFGAPTDYSTAKASVLAFSKNIARKLGKEIRVNVVAPGNIYFEGSSWDEKIQLDKDKISRMIEDNVPMSRFGKCQEVADAAVFLSSQRASFITGSVLVVDGGQTVSII